MTQPPVDPTIQQLLSRENQRRASEMHELRILTFVQRSIIAQSVCSVHCHNSGAFCALPENRPQKPPKASKSEEGGNVLKFPENVHIVDAGPVEAASGEKPQPVCRHTAGGDVCNQVKQVTTQMISEEFQKAVHAMAKAAATPAIIVPGKGPAQA